MSALHSLLSESSNSMAAVPPVTPFAIASSIATSAVSYAATHAAARSISDTTSKSWGMSPYHGGPRLTSLPRSNSQTNNLIQILRGGDLAEDAASAATEAIKSVKAAATPESTFDMGLAKTRLEGLAYGTVTTLMMSAALGLFSSTPKKIQLVPKEGEDEAKIKSIKLNNALVILFSITISFSVALGAYTTIVFTLMSIYSKTALGMNLQSQYQTFFDHCAIYRQTGFKSFVSSIFLFDLGWVLSLLLRFDDFGALRWVIATPALVIAIWGLVHFKDIMGTAGDLLYHS